MNRIEDYLTQKHSFSGCVLIARQGDILLHKAYGLSDIEKNLENTTNTRFSTASAISKPITAIATFQLIEKGVLSLNQKIGVFFPAFKTAPITLHHLLNHTSGIPNYLMLRKVIDTKIEYTPDEIIHMVHAKGLSFRPGKKFSYNNTGFLMLGSIIEQVTGSTYEQYVKDNIFAPAEMKDSGFERENLDNTAKNYIKGEAGNFFHPSLLFACGEIHSTVKDLYRLDRALKEQRLLREETVKRMEEPSHHGKWMTIGYPWLIKDQFERRSICHGGTHPCGYVSHFERYLEDDMTIIVLSNNMVKHSRLSLKELGATWIARELAELMFAKKLRFWQKFL